jgi:matrix metalloproteinase-14 (membrane-inserted)
MPTTKKLTDLLRQKASAKSEALPPAEIRFTISYLQQFGYLPKGNSSTEKQFREALSTAQKFLAVPAHGELTPQTVRAMVLPRCGVRDVARVGGQQWRWNKRQLKFFIDSYVQGIPKAAQEAIFQQAWDDWTQHSDTGVTLTRTRSEADIYLGTGRGRRSAFDGPGNTLAWAELPPGNDQPLNVKFDLDEMWVLEMGRARSEILLRNVACHEFGHSWGLDHSQLQSALMAPFYTPNIRDPQQADDVVRYRRLYPAATPTPPPAQTTTLSIQSSGRLEIRAPQGTQVIFV